MPHSCEGMSEFEFQAEFTKDKIINLSEKIKKYLLVERSINASVWQLNPWLICYKIITDKPDIATEIYQIFKMPEVMNVQLLVEPLQRVVMLQVHLGEKWFVGKESDGPPKKIHPENRPDPIV